MMSGFIKIYKAFCPKVKVDGVSKKESPEALCKLFYADVSDEDVASDLKEGLEAMALVYNVLASRGYTGAVRYHVKSYRSTLGRPDTLLGGFFGSLDRLEVSKSTNTELIRCARKADD